MAFLVFSRFHVAGQRLDQNCFLTLHFIGILAKIARALALLGGVENAALG